jgi:hypothetical protein
MQDLDLGLLICSEKWLQSYPGKISNKYKNICNYDSNYKRRNKISMLAIQRIVSKKQIKNRQSSLSEFID